MTPLKVILSISGLYVIAADTLRQTNSLKRYGEHQKGYISPYGSPQIPNSSPNRSLASHQIVANQQTVTYDQPNRIDFIMENPPSPPSPNKDVKHPLSPMTNTQPPKRFKGEGRFDDAQGLLDDHTSPIYKDQMPLKKIFASLHAQETLAASGVSNGIQGADSEEFSTAAAAFKEDGREGRHDPEWVSQATLATNLRQRGDFNDYEAAKFDKDWATEKRELSDDEDDKERRNLGKGSCNGDSKKVRKDDEFDDKGEGGATERKAFGHRPTSSGSNYSKSDNKILRSDSGNGSQQGNTRHTMLTTNRKMSQIPMAPLHPLAVPPTYSSQLVNTDHQVRSKSRVVVSETGSPNPKSSTGMKNVGKVKGIHRKLRHDKLSIKLKQPIFRILGSSGMDGGGNLRQDWIRMHPSFTFLPKAANAELNQDFENWPGRGYVDNPNSVYPEILWIPGQSVQVLPRHRRV